MPESNPHLPLFESQQRASERLRRRKAAERIARLRSLERHLLSAADEMAAALDEDFGKPYEEVLLTELAPVVVELRHTVRHLRRWMKPKRISTHRVLTGSVSRVHCEAKGPSLIIAPWNYSFTLSLCPVISAVAAGCPAVLKPSELTPAASALIGRMLADVFPEEEIAVREGDAATARQLLDLPFRHVYFTGSPATGSKVMAAAARHLASVTLELGGKSPAVVDRSANVEAATHRIAFGKFANAGQTCIAPDYLLVHDDVYPAFVSALTSTIERFYGSRENGPFPEHGFSRIVNPAHARRLADLLEEATREGAETLLGGWNDVDGAKFSPTVITGVNPKMRIMQEEIFGPILPVLSYSDEEDLLETLGDGPPPLTLYVFSGSRKSARRLIDRVVAGSVSVNETLLHFANPDLPFGGLSTSGIGRGHGHAGFLAFSNEKAVFRQRVGPWLFSHMQPPFTARTRRWIRALIRFS